MTKGGFPCILSQPSQRIVTQLIAIGDEGKRVIAQEAQRKKDYYCPGCAGVVRLRYGPHIQAHFYHYTKTNSCHHRKKSLAHINTQLHLLRKLPEGEGVLEYFFTSVGRIADLFWENKGIVFEVQCSPMTASEAKEREEDYQSLGMHLIWILHEGRFNRRKLSSAEQIFTSRNAYYTSIDATGKGEIYDQFAVIQGDKRRFQGAKFTICPHLPYSFHQLTRPKTPCPLAILKRFETRTIGFAGDVVDTTLKKPDYNYASLLTLENRYLRNPSSFRSWIQQFIAIYRALLHALLEKHLF